MLEEEFEYEDDTPQEVEDNRRLKKELEWAKAKKKHENMDFTDILKTSAGRMVLWRILIECGVFAACATNEAIDMARGEGKRDVGLWLLEEISYIPGDFYPIMVAEAAEREARYRPRKGGK